MEILMDLQLQTPSERYRSPFVQIPTTLLLAQVDSSVGGKTGVDFDQYKKYGRRILYAQISLYEWSVPEDTG